MHHVRTREADLALGRAARWLDRNLDQFRLVHAATLEQRIQLMKPLGELALAASVLSSCGHRQDWCRDKLQFVWDELDQGDAVLHLLAARPDLIVASTLYACFVQFGFRNARLDHLIEHLASSPACLGIEFPTWRRLDVAHGFEMLGLASFPGQPQEGTWLEKRPEPWLMTDDIAYAVTHEIFYITNFGRQRSRLSGQVASYVTTWLPAWLEIYERQENWDLYAEFVMTAACLDLERSENTSRLVSQMTIDGYFPGPDGSASSLVDGNKTSSRKVLLQNYHTTLVSMMAIVL